MFRGVRDMKKPRENRVPIMLSDDELNAIDDWRFENRVATRSAAIRRLVQVGLRFMNDGRVLAESMDQSTSYLMRWEQSVTALLSEEGIDDDVLMSDATVSLFENIFEAADRQYDAHMRLASLVQQMNALMFSRTMAQAIQRADSARELAAKKADELKRKED